MNKRTFGRPPALDGEKRKELCAVIAMGGSRTMAARYVGVHPHTVRRTAARDPDFAAQLAQAESKHELKLLARIDRAAGHERFWRAAAWKLERKYPQAYRPRRPETVTAEQLGEVVAAVSRIVVQAVPMAKERQRLRRLLSRVVRRLQGNEGRGALLEEWV